MKIGIHPFANGSAYNWGKLRSLLDFFYPQNIQIRREAITVGNNIDGVVSRDFYTFRAFFWHLTNTFLINPLGNLYLQLNQMYQLRWELVALLIFGSDPTLIPLMAGAIAFDTSSGAAVTPGQTSPMTMNHTVTGANTLMLIAADDESGNNITTFQYNSVAATQVSGSPVTAQGFSQYLAYLVAPSTGTNSVSVSGWAAGNSVGMYAASYSGCAQSSQPDSAGTNNAAAGTSFSVATTVVAANCWLGGVFGGPAVVSAGANTTVRQQPSNQRGYADSNATVGTGSQSLAYTTASGGGWEGIVASIAPFVASSSGSIAPRSLMGVGV